VDRIDPVTGRTETESPVPSVLVRFGPGFFPVLRTGPLSTSHLRSPKRENTQTQLETVGSWIKGSWFLPSIESFWVAAGLADDEQDLSVASYA
jgi:hypothetical protein